MKNYSEFCEQQGKKLFEIIDQHNGLLQWKRSWNVKANLGLPLSANGYYRGINLWKLLFEQTQRGLGSDTWLTFKQVRQQGGHVLKGAKGTQVCFFKIKEIETDEEGETINRLIPLFRVYTVFNLDQTSLANENSNHSKSNLSVHELINQFNVNVSNFGNQPCYKMGEDVIVMPRLQSFNSAQDYDATLLHELVHWTGHPARLNRDSIKNYSLNDASRAEEELVAEIGSVFLTAHLGLSGELVNHASYIASWKVHLEPKAIGRAMSQASKAFHWLINHQNLGEKGAF